jgi:hypothetical protein
MDVEEGLLPSDNVFPLADSYEAACFPSKCTADGHFVLDILGKEIRCPEGEEGIIMAHECHGFYFL